MGAAKRARRGLSRMGTVFLVASLLLGSSVWALAELPPTATAAPLGTPSISTQLSSSKITVLGSVTDNATLTGATSYAGGNVNYSYFNGGTCSGPPIVTPTLTNHLSVPVTNGRVPVSPSVPFISPGSYSWNAFYSGDVNNKYAVSPCEPLTVAKFAPILSIRLYYGNMSIGNSDSAIASLTFSSTTAGGTVQYEYFPSNVCTGANTTIGAPVTVTSGTVPDSGSKPFSKAGIYSWYAVYTGDSINNGATSQCVRLIVMPAGVTANPYLSAAGGSSPPIPVGGSVTDSVRLFSATSNAGGTVTYYYFDNPNHNDLTCTGPGHAVNTVTVVNGKVPPSAPQQFKSAGTYSWNAAYSGDQNNTATSACKKFTVDQASPTITLSLSSAAIARHGSVTGSANLTGGFQATGTVTFKVFSGGTCAPVNSSGTVGGHPPIINNTATSVPWYPDPGTYSWQATYSGDGNNALATSQCQSLAVNSGDASITAVLHCASLTTSLPCPGIGPYSSAYGTAALSGTTSGAGGDVKYEFFSGSCFSGVAKIVGSAETVTNGTVPSSALQQFNISGSYNWIAVYSGDSNNKGATSPCELLNVGRVATTDVKVTCTSASVALGSAANCKATVQSSGVPASAGTVTWSNSGSGKFSKLTCTLSRGACSVKFTPTAASSPVTLTANYGRNSKYLNSSSLPFDLTVSMKVSTTTVSCPQSVRNTKTVRCTATVRGYGDLSNESVTWTQSGTGFVSFSASTCPLSGSLSKTNLFKGSCSVTLTGARLGNVLVQVIYGGDSNNYGIPPNLTITAKLTVN